VPIPQDVAALERTPNASETLDRYATYMMGTWGARPHWGQQDPMNKARLLAQQLGSRDQANVS
jgi:hypothetical protein